MATKKAASKKSTSAKKASPKESTSSKSSSRRKYSGAASQDVQREMHEFKRGRLKSGRSGKKVTNPRQAIAIGLSEARREGKKVPPPPKRRAA
jgi:hypothetical protein